MCRFKGIALYLLILLGMMSLALCIESLDESGQQNSAEDAEEGYSATMFIKDIIMKRNPAVKGNTLKDLWERVPAIEVAGSSIKK